MASAGAAPARVSEQQQPAVVITKPSFLIRCSTGAACFYWIAGLTLLNSLVVFLGISLHFIIGLGISTVVDANARGLGTIGVVLDLLINGTIAGIFFVLGSLAFKRAKWAFIVGMVLYGLDGLLLLAKNDILSVVFHAYSLYAISRALTANTRA
jgi:hypothetical protein